MVLRNQNFSKLQTSYLFVEIGRRVQAFKMQNPTCKLINLGIGDTTAPLPNIVTQSLMKAARDLGSAQGYSGYGPACGIQPLRHAIADKIYSNQISADEVYLSDGSKCDVGRLQLLFDPKATVAVQDPSYPVYVDTSVIFGRSETCNLTTKQYEGIVYMPCTPENNFFPDLNTIQKTDLIYFCAPNNPTGAVPTFTQLQNLVDFALQNQSIIIFDSAYAAFIQDDTLPKSIYEIPGAKKCAIETGSFSKLAGFTGLRLGWTVIPKELLFLDQTPIYKDYERILSTFFNGASNIAQQGGLAVLTDEGMAATQAICQSYMQNAALLRQTFEDLNLKCYGGQHAPYLWVSFDGKNSWDVFDELLHQAHVIVTPGSGFGPAGDGFIRLSAFGQKKEFEQANERLKILFSLAQ